MCKHGFSEHRATQRHAVQAPDELPIDPGFHAVGMACGMECGGCHGCENGKTPASLAGKIIGFIILLIMGMGTTVTGLIIRFTPTAVGGVAAIILAPFTLIAGNMWQPLLFIAGFVVMMIVPGHILNYKSNHPAR